MIWTCLEKISLAVNLLSNCLDSGWITKVGSIELNVIFSSSSLTSNSLLQWVLQVVVVHRSLSVHKASSTWLISHSLLMLKSDESSNRSWTINSKSSKRKSSLSQNQLHKLHWTSSDLFPNRSCQLLRNLITCSTWEISQRSFKVSTCSTDSTAIPKWLFSDSGSTSVSVFSTTDSFHLTIASNSRNSFQINSNKLLAPTWKNARMKMNPILFSSIS